MKTFRCTRNLLVFTGLLLFTHAAHSSIYETIRAQIQQIEPLDLSRVFRLIKKSITEHLHVHELPVLVFNKQFPLLIETSFENPNTKLWRELEKLQEKQKIEKLKRKENDRLIHLQYCSKEWAIPDEAQKSTSSKSYHQSTSVPGIIQFGKEKTIGEYTMTREVLGEGRFGKVYKGYHTTTRMPVAIKIILYNELAFREIRASQRLQAKPHVVSILAYLGNKQKTTITLVMDYCDGGDLEHAITAGLDLKRVKNLFKQLLHGLRDIRDEHMMHRDIKPANLLLCRDGTLKIADFGFAKIQETQALFQSQIGTPMYMSPERLRAEEYAFSSEMWSAGLILYEMLFGHHPFTQARNIPELRAMTERGVHTSCDFLNRLLAFDPAQRLTIEQALEHPWFNQEPEETIKETMESDPRLAEVIRLIDDAEFDDCEDTTSPPINIYTRAKQILNDILQNLQLPQNEKELAEQTLQNLEQKIWEIR